MRADGALEEDIYPQKLKRDQREFGRASVCVCDSVQVDKVR